MTLREAYPGCPDAVTLCESAIEQWELMRARFPAMSPAQAVEIVKMGLDMACRQAAQRGVRATLLTLVGDQMDHPDFARYVAAKLGMM